MNEKKSLKLKLSVSQRALVYVLVPFLFQMILFAVLSAVLEESVRQEEQEHRSKSLIARANWLAVVCLSGNLGVLGHVLTGDPFYKSVFNRSQDFLAKEKGGMTDLVANQEERETLNQIDQQTTTLFGVLSKAEEQFAQPPEAASDNAALSYLQKSNLKDTWQELNQLRHVLLRRDRESFNLSPNAVPNKLKTARNVMAIFVFADIVVALFFIHRYGKDIAVRLKSLTDNTRRFAEGRDLNPPVSGNDELKELDQSFHGMTELLKEARDKERIAYEAVLLSQAKFRNLVEHMPLGLFALDEAGSIRSVNPVAAALFTLDSERIIGKQMSHFFDDEKNLLSAALADKTATEQRLEMIGKREDHSSFPVELVITAVTGEEQLRIISVQDITQRYEIERLKSEFVAMVTHDLRTPLTTIKATLMMLPTGHFGMLNELGSSRIQAGIRETDRLTRLVNDLLDTARLEAGKFDLEPGDYSLATIVDTAVGGVSEFAAKNKVHVAIQSLDVMVHCDSDRIIQVLFNLLTNAIKYSPAQSTVTLVCEQEDQKVRIAVQDKGRGIPESHLKIVFEKFGQVERADARDKGGTGLGLAICKAIVEQHKGVIGATSVMGAGSTFYFTLPLATPLATPNVDATRS
jgi:PAS domain S-box-containing protein